MNEYNSFIKGIGIVGIMNLLVGLSSIILIPILTKNYTIDEYGIWVQLSVTVSLLPNLISLGLPYALIRYFSTFNEKFLDGFYSINALVLFSSLIVSFFLFLFSKSISEFLFGGADSVALILPIILFFSCLNLLYLNYFLTFQKTKLYSIFLFLQSYLNILFSIIVTWMNLEFIFIIIGYLLSQLIVCILMFTIIIKTIGFKIPHFHNVKSYLEYSIPTIPSNVSAWAVESSDRYLIGLMMGLTFVGYYAPSYNLAMMIKMFFLPFATLLLPVLSVKYDKLEFEKVSKYLKYSSKYFFLVAIPSAFAISILSYPILNLLTTPEIASQGFLVVPFVALTAILYGSYGIVSQVILLEKKTKISGLIWLVAAIVNIVLNIILIPIIGIIGAAFTTLLAYLIAFSLTFFYASKYFKFDFNLVFVVKSILSSIIMSLFILTFNPSSFIDICLTITVSTMIYIIVLLLIKGIEIDELKIILKTLKIKQ